MKIVITVDQEKGVGVEASTPPIVTLGLLALAQSALLAQMKGEPGEKPAPEKPRIELVTGGGAAQINAASKLAALRDKQR